MPAVAVRLPVCWLSHPLSALLAPSYHPLLACFCTAAPADLPPVVPLAPCRWALGVLVFELVGGLPPFYCEDKLAMYQRVVHLTYSFPAHFSKVGFSRAGGGCQDVHTVLLLAAARAVSRAGLPLV